MKRSFRHALPIGIGALAAVATLAVAPPASAAPKKSEATPITIYSETFTPLKRIYASDSIQHRRYSDGPGQAPNRFYASGFGYEAFFNTPDIVLGADPMSAVSAEVCLTFSSTDSNEYVGVMFGVQDKDRNFILGDDPDNPGSYGILVSASDSQQCVTLTFATPVQLVNHPHLVTALVMQFETGGWAEVDGVTYTLRPTQEGDLVPAVAPMGMASQTLFPVR